VPDSGTYFGIPANSRTATILRELNLAINKEALAGSALVAAQSGSKQLNSPLQLATENLRRAREGLTYRALNSRPFSAMVLMMETWNVQVAISEINKVILERGKMRAEFGTLSTRVDLALAVEALAAKLSSSQPLTAFAERALLEIPDNLVKKVLGTRLAKYVVRTVTVRILATAFAGLLLAGLSLSDALHSARWSDNAIWGHYMMTAGGLLGAGAALMSGSALFGPVGLVAVALIISGATLVALFSNTDFEDWLAGSVFGEEGTLSSAMRHVADLIPFMNGSSRYLEEPDEAFYRLAGLLSGITIQVGNNPDYDPQARIDGDSSPEALAKRANTRIVVVSNIIGLAAQLGGSNQVVRCCLIKNEISVTRTPQGDSYQSRLRLLPGQSTPVLTHGTDHAMTLYVNTPDNTRQVHQRSEQFDEYRWEVRAQVRLEDRAQGKIWAFPAPTPKIAPVDATQHAEPDFRKTDQLLWADQETHGVTGDRA